MITNNIGDEETKLLSELITENKTIQFLSIMMDGLTNVSIETLAKALGENNSLMYLDWA